MTIDRFRALEAVRSALEERGFDLHIQE